MTDELSELKKSNWTLKQELEAYRQENGRLNQTVQQWYTWSQDIQGQLQEKDQQIDNLQNKIAALESEKAGLQGRLSTADAAMTENLYEQNKRLELKLKETEEDAEVMDRVLFLVLNKSRQTIPREIIGSLKKSRKAEFRIYAYLIEQDKPVRESDITSRLSLSRKDSEQAFSKLMREQMIEEYTSGVYTVTRMDMQATGVASSAANVTPATGAAATGQQDIFSHTLTKLGYSSTVQESRSVLSDLKDHLVSKGMSNLSFEVLQVMRNLTATSDSRDLQQKVKKWQREYEDSQKVEVKVEEVDLMSLSNYEIFEAVRKQVKAAGKVTAAANHIEKMKDVLMQKSSASGTLLYDMNKTVNEAKKGATTTGHLVSKIDEWQEKVN